MALSRRNLLAGAGALAAIPVVGRAAEADLSFREIAETRNLAFGCAVEPEVMDRDQEFAALVRRQADVLTPENAMKWNALRPSQDRFEFAAGDHVVALAQAQNAFVHGHCLVWHEAMPDWTQTALDRRTAHTLLLEHIRTVVGHYAGRVQSWDVVNEAVERNDKRPDGLRASPWLKALGPDYIDQAFHMAIEADPSARLAISDYGLEYDNVDWMVDKRQTLLGLLHGMRTRDVPVHALAIQGHLDASRPPVFGEGLYRFLGQVANLGYEIYITELDVNDQMLPGTVAQRDAIIADHYRAFLKVALLEPAVKMVNTWGLSDRHTSKSTMFPRADGAEVRPLPFDSELRPKAAALAIAEALRAAPSLRT
jgi:endo-1,4-beta-xylanase